MMSKIKLLLSLLIIICSVGYIFKTEIVQAALYYPYSSKFKINTDKFKILLLWGSGMGEREHMQRIKIAAERIGIDLRAVSDNIPQFGFDKYVQHRGKIAAKAYKPDLIFVLERGVSPLPGFKNYAWIDQSPERAMLWGDYSKFDALLPLFKDVSSYPNTYKLYFNWYPTSYKTDYVAKQPQKLFYPGGVVNDDTRSQANYTQIFKLLDTTNYFAVYGVADRWKHTPHSYEGLLPFDGISILKVANDAGVSLVLHAYDHLSNGLPTGRIFEAAAANTVIISDKNKFVQDNFGDNVLYIDVNQKPEEVFAQIDAHMQWIFAHPEQARQMAERCHAIVNEQFTFEDQLQRLVDLHKELTAQAG